jgi:hypothetical protein
MLAKILKIIGFSQQQVQYFLSDPTSPELFEWRTLPPPRQNAMFKMVQDHKNCQIAINDTIDSVQRVLSSIGRPIKKWAATRELLVNPQAGNDTLNAFYNRKAIKFFCSRDKRSNRVICLANSPDVAAHETGHAILDALRPDLWSVQSVEIWAFHEAFADIIAVQAAMQHKSILHVMLEQTHGNIRNSNIASKIGEEVGQSTGSIHQCIRDACTNFLYVNPKTLPIKAPDYQLSSGSHSFGRVFLGMWYDMLVAIYEQSRQSVGDLSALENARDIATRYLIRAALIVPKTPSFFRAVAETMLSVDRSEGGRYSKIMREVFENRRVLKPQIKMLSNKEVDLEKYHPDLIFRHEWGIHVTERNTSIVKLSNLFLLASKSSPLYHCNVEIPLDSSCDIGPDGRPLNEIVSTYGNAVEDAALSVSIIDKQNDTLDNKAMWEIYEDRLSRNFIE